MKLTENTTWVVYLMTVTGKFPGRHAVCSTVEWEELEAARPGHHTLVRRITGSEGEAEKCARGLQLPPEPPPRKRPPLFARLPDHPPAGNGIAATKS